jgi:alpha-glucoside transport system substrate-binding protein
MAVLARRRRAGALAGVAALALLAAACGQSKSGDNSTGSSGDASLSPECQPYAAYHVDKKKTVSVYATIRDTEADKLTQSWAEFEKCTNIKIAYEGTAEFETQIKVRVDGGNAPDLAVFPQPGLMTNFVKSGKVKAPAQSVKDMVAKGWGKEWADFGSVNGTFYAAPLGSNVKSFVWYNPQLFKEKSYKIPTTWDELIALSDKMAADGIKPWCAGIGSGEATGWPATDWMEDVILRDQGPDVYDQWVTHKIPFNDPRIIAAADRVGSILKNPKYVNGGIGDVKSIATTTFQDGGLPVKDKKCGMHRQASFYANQWPKGTKVAEDGDIYAFYFPTVDPAKGKPVLVAGEFVAAFADREEVVKTQTYLASKEWANSRGKLGDWLSSNKGLDISVLANPIDKLSAQILQDPKAVSRFDGSDLMPGEVGAGSFWKQMTAWITGKDTKSALTDIENSWPK